MRLRHRFHSGCGLLVFFLLFVLGATHLWFVYRGLPWNLLPLDTEGTQWAIVIGIAMAQYADDHGGKYPEGKSSTEVFQKLLDGKYLADSYYFWLPLRGKVEGIRGQKLKPENVCFDVTCCISRDDPDDLPIVFATGCKVTYAPGSAAIPLVNPFPQYGPGTWYQWWCNEPESTTDLKREQGICVYYKSKRATCLPLTSSANSDGTILNFIPPDFDAKGKSYRQLTPDGTLSP